MIGKNYKIVFENHVRRGELHGEIINETDYEIKLRQFTDDNLIVAIKKEQITEIYEL